MKIALEVKNISKAIKPITDDVVVYDGKEWYVTTKSELLKEANETLEKCKEQLEKNKQEFENFKKDVASQLVEMSELIGKLYSK